MSRIPDRRDEIAAFFAAHANHIRVRVARRARTAPDVVDDACATAWTKLLRRPDVALNAHGRAWLITVALHEAWRLQERRTFETPVGPFARGSTVDDGHAPEPVDAFGVDVETQAVDRIQHSEDAAAFLTLKPRERQALYCRPSATATPRSRS